MTFIELETKSMDLRPKYPQLLVQNQRS